MKKLALSASAASTLIPVAALGQHYDISDQVLSLGASSLYIDFDAGTFSSTAFAASDIRVYFGAGNLEFPAVNPDGNWGVAVNSSGGSYTKRYTYGASLDFTFTKTVNSSILEVFGTGEWEGQNGTTTSYLGVKNMVDQREAWIGIRYNDAANSMTIESFAVAPGSANMLAGHAPIPEPAQAGAVMALVAGAAVMYRRRQGGCGLSCGGRN